MDDCIVRFVRFADDHGWRTRYWSSAECAAAVPWSVATVMGWILSRSTAVSTRWAIRASPRHVLAAGCEAVAGHTLSTWPSPTRAVARFPPRAADAQTFRVAQMLRCNGHHMLRRESTEGEQSSAQGALAGAALAPNRSAAESAHPEPHDWLMVARVSRQVYWAPTLS